MNESPKFPLPRDRDMKAMTLRDYFAAHVAPDVLHHFNWEPKNIEAAATLTFELADAMLKAREQ